MLEHSTHCKEKIQSEFQHKFYSILSLTEKLPKSKDEAFNGHPDATPMPRFQQKQVIYLRSLLECPLNGIVNSQLLF